VIEERKGYEMLSLHTKYYGIQTKLTTMAEKILKHANKLNERIMFASWVGTIIQRTSTFVLIAVAQ
jgi:hypothetical protein